METVTGLEVAIVGMAVRLPGADSLDEFWDGLLSSKDILKMQQQRYPLQSGNLGGVLDNVDGFDAAFFDISAREACLMDPQLRQSLEVSWHALEDAGLINQRAEAHIGIYSGAPTSAYLTYGISNQERLDVSIEIDELIHHNSQELFASKLAYQLGVTGPAISLTTGCSTSLVLLHTACLALNGGDCETALVVASRVGYPHYDGYHAAPGGPLSRDGLCRPFAKDATGMVPSSGTVALVLRRYDDAVTSGDRIYAVIRGSAVNNDGRDKLGYAAPSVNGQAQVARQAMMNADVEPCDVSYVEAHGTGTELGDGVELRALQQAYSSGNTMHRCALGSVKGNIGHLDAASGLASIVKVSLMLHNHTLLPTINCEVPMAQLAASDSVFNLQQTVTPWHSAKPLIAGINVFGIGGTNGHVLLQQANEHMNASCEAQSNIVFISGKDTDAVLRYRDKLSAWLVTHPDCNLKQLSWTLLNCKAALSYRTAMPLQSLRDLKRLDGITSQDVVNVCAEPLLSLGYVSCDNFDAVRRLIEGDVELEASFINHLAESKAIYTSISHSPSMWEGVRRALGDTQLSKFINRAVWLSVLTHLEARGIEFTKMHATGSLFITLAEWAKILSPAQALALLANQTVTHFAICPSSVPYSLFYSNDLALSAEEHWQDISFWLEHNEPSPRETEQLEGCFKLTLDKDVSSLVAQLWMQGTKINSETYFGETLAPLTVPGYAFAPSQFSLPIKTLQSTQWLSPRWTKLANNDIAKRHILVLLSKGAAAKKVRQRFAQADKNVWFVYHAEQFSAAKNNELYADLTQVSQLEQLEHHVKKASDLECSWIDARLSVFSTKPECLLNMMVDGHIRQSWQALDNHLAEVASNWTVLCFISNSSKAMSQSDFVAQYVLNFFAFQYHYFALQQAPKTLTVAEDKRSPFVRNRVLLSSALLSQLGDQQAIRFNIVHNRLFALNYSQFVPFDCEKAQFGCGLILGIEQSNGVAIASALMTQCKQLHIILPANFPAQHTWSSWLKEHVEGNAYSEIIALLLTGGEHKFKCTWQTINPNGRGVEVANNLDIDVCVNIVSADNMLAQPEKLFAHNKQQQRYQRLLSKLMSKNPLLSSLILIHGSSVADLMSSAGAWQRITPNVFSSLVFCAKELNKTIIDTCFDVLTQPSHHMLFDRCVIEQLTATKADKTLRLVEELPYAPRPSLAEPFVEPESELERKIAQIWQNYFYVAPIGRNDDFFNLNGHSLLALKMVNQINELCASELTLRDVLENPTIAKLSQLVETSEPAVAQGAA